jgi:hypothetical protein
MRAEYCTTAAGCKALFNSPVGSDRAPAFAGLPLSARRSGRRRTRARSGASGSAVSASMPGFSFSFA